MKETTIGSRILRHTRVPIEITSLRRINILFGKNGTGKSTFLRNIYSNFVNDFHLIVPERGGDEMKYSSGTFDEENVESKKKNARSKNYDSGYRTRAFSRAMGIINGLGNKALRGDYSTLITSEEITTLFGIFLPEFRVTFNESSPYNLIVYRRENEGDILVSGADQLSTGQSEALSLAADIITQAVQWKDSEKTILIDEPDAHLHIDLEKRFSIFIREISNNFNLQFIIASHSPSLISNFLSVDDELGIICFDEKSEKIKTLKSAHSSIIANLLSSDLTIAIVLKRKIIIVEGNDDFLVWNQATRSQNFSGIALVQAEGADILIYKTNAEKILDAILDEKSELGITILDGDGKNEFQNQPGAILPAVRMNCNSLENLYFSYEVIHKINPEIDLTLKLQEIVAEQGYLNADEVIEVNAIIADKRQTRVSKQIIKKIHAKIDPYSSSRDWRVLIGKILGESRPAGELADFLGVELVKIIWGNIVNPAIANIVEDPGVIEYQV